MSIQKKKNSRKLTAKKGRQKAFLEAFKLCATITHAADIAKIARKTHYDWLDKDQEYVRAFQEAEIAATDALTQEARRRAVEGVSEPVYYQGEVVGTIQRYSDVLLMFLMKGAMPETYRERHEFSGGDKSIGIDLDPGRKKLSDDTLEKLIALLEESESN